jgi:hypothetical protein
MGFIDALFTLTGSLVGTITHYATISQSLTLQGAITSSQKMHRAIEGVLSFVGSLTGTRLQKVFGAGSAYLSLDTTCLGYNQRHGAADAQLALSGAVTSTVNHLVYGSLAMSMTLDATLNGQDVTTTLAPVERTANIAESVRVVDITATQNTAGV